MHHENKLYIKKRNKKGGKNPSSNAPLTITPPIQGIEGKILRLKGSFSHITTIYSKKQNSQFYKREH